MKEQLVTFETAKLAKEKGFDESCLYVFENSSELDIIDTSYAGSSKNWFRNSEGNITAPTQSLLQKWLREVYNIVVIVSPANKGKYFGIIYPTEDSTITYNKQETYEEALEQVLFEALKLIKL